MIANRPVLSDQGESGLDRSGIDQPIGWIAGKCGRKIDGGVRDRWRYSDRANLLGQALEPGPNRHRDRDPLVPRKPCQLVPRDCGNDEFISAFQRLARTSADSLRLRRPPMNDVGIEQRCTHAQAAFQRSPVENNCSSLPAVIAMPSAEPFNERAPEAGTRRATGCPCRVISISSPAAASSKRRRIVAFASVAVTCLDIWSV